MADLIRLVDALVTRLKNGKTLVIHCNGGKGRSGTVAVACMVAMGQRVDKSIDVVRKARSGTIRNPLQIVYVKRFKSAFKKYIKKKKALIEARGGSTAMPKEEWDALAQQVAADAVLESSSSSESDANSMEGDRRSTRKYKKDEEKAQEKARKEEEKASEKARKEEEKARREDEKAQERLMKDEEKARKEEEKASEKARKEDEKAHEKARKEEEKAIKEQEKAVKRGSTQLTDVESLGVAVSGTTASTTAPATGSGKGPARNANHTKANSKRGSTEYDSDAVTSGASSNDLGSQSAPTATNLPPISEVQPVVSTSSSESKSKQGKAHGKQNKDSSSLAAPADSQDPLLTPGKTDSPLDEDLPPINAVANGTNSPSVARANAKRKAKKTAVTANEEAGLSGTGSE